MLDIKELTKALKQVADEKGLQPEAVMEAVEAALAAAYKREYGQRSEVIKCTIDQKLGALKFERLKTVVDETTVRFVSEEEMAEERAKAEAEAAERKVEKPQWQKMEEIEIGEDGEPKLPRFNPERHITLDDAKKIKKGAVLGEELSFRSRDARGFRPHRRADRKASDSCRSFANRNATLY